MGDLVTPPSGRTALHPRVSLAVLNRRYRDEPFALQRTKDGRDLSQVRYHRAEEFFPSNDPRSSRGWRSFLYMSGITAQLGLSSHLLDVGFPDYWNARHIGYRVSKSLAYANATGLDHRCPDMARLAVVLTPYWKWNSAQQLYDKRDVDDGGFSVVQVRHVLRALLDQIREVTGHSQPDGWHRHRKDAQA